MTTPYCVPARRRCLGWQLLAAFSFCGAAIFAQKPAGDLDSIVRRVIAQDHAVGASVLVARNGEVILHRGYGFADLGLDAPGNAETVYGVVAPMMPFTGVAVMQLVERGQLSLDDDISKFIPESREE